MKRVVVVGAGIGGLTAAALLSARGFVVTVVDAGAAPGGKIRSLDVGGVAVEGGPTVFTMRWVFDEVFAACGGALDDAVTLTPAHILARHAWEPDTRLDLFADDAASADAIGDFAGAADARGFAAFMAEARGILRTLDAPFLRASATTPLGLTARIGLRGLPGLIGIHPFATLWGRLGHYFADPRLRQLFGRYATYAGSSPFEAPATLMLIAAVEADGVWLVDGGMTALARAVEQLGQANGATYRYGAAVTGVGAHGVTLADGETLAADAVVWGGDPDGLRGLLPGALKPLDARERSLSALVWTCDATASGFSLVRHNVFFSPDYAREFVELKAGRVPSDPSVYVCAQDRESADSPATAPATECPERLQLIVNAPALRDGAAGEDGFDACTTATFERLRRCGLDLAMRASVLTTPTDFAAAFPGSAGALYGAATHGSTSAFKRPGARTKFRWLYLAGGGTHPGAGVPMAALSGIQAAHAVAAAHAST